MGMSIDEAIKLMIQGSKYDYDGSAEDFCEAYNMSIEIMRKYQKIEQIRAEIEQEYNRFRNMSDKWSERACGLGTALEIIDKALKNLNESMEQFENGEVSDGTNI